MPTVYETVARVTGTEIPNYDAKAGFHYGTCYVNDGILDEAIDITTWRELAYEEALDGFEAELWAEIAAAAYPKVDEVFQESQKKRFMEALKDAVSDLVGETFGENYESMGEGVYLYEDNGYLVEFRPADNSVIVLKSPYYAEVGGCSPCFPNGGYISKPGGVLAYTLGHDWWEEGKAPTDIFAVATNEKVLAPEPDLVL
jgi:hypothetical protein